MLPGLVAEVVRSSWQQPDLSCLEVKGRLKRSYEDALGQVEELQRTFQSLAMQSFVEATSVQELPKSWSWWQPVAPLLPLAAAAFNMQAALCAREKGCCKDLLLGEAMLTFRRAQDKMSILTWLGTFQGSFALAPDTVEGRYLQGEAWNEELDDSYAKMSPAERVRHQALAEYRFGEQLFDLFRQALHEALEAVWMAEAPGATGRYPASMVALYELANIRTVDEGLMRWLSDGIFRDKSIVEFGALNGGSAEWLNRSRATRGAWAFDGAPHVFELTQGRVAEQDLTQPFQLSQGFDWALCLEVAEHIPEAKLPVFLDNLRRHLRQGLVLSWSWCGAGGTGHVSCRSREEVQALLEQFGLVADAEASLAAQAASTVWWISRTVQVFRTMA